MYREKIKELEKWKNNKIRKPLILQGAKKVGKTYLVKEFTKNNYKNVIYINLNSETEKSEKEKDIFEIINKEKNIEIIKNKIEEITNTNLENNETVIILDELEKSKNVRQLLKNIKKDDYKFDIIGIMSNWGVTLQEEQFTKSQVDIIKLAPLNFFEFLIAIGESELLKILKEKNTEEIEEKNIKLKNNLKKYIYIGGMPEVVNDFVKNKNFQNIRNIQKNIISEYEREIKKAPSFLRENILKIWNQISLNLIKEYKVTRYGDFRNGGNAGEFDPAIRWLQDLGLIYKVPEINKIEFPLLVYEDISKFKLFYLDIGILSAKIDLNLAIVLKEDEIFELGNEALSEQFVMQELKENLDMNIYCYKSKNLEHEINFVIQYKGKIYPIRLELKRNVKDSSLRYVHEEFQNYTCVHITPNTYKWYGWYTDIPIYMTGNMPPYEDREKILK